MLLESQTTLVLATSNQSAAPLFYHYEPDLTVYWVSGLGSRHSTELGSGGRAAIAVFAPVTDWRGIRGVQMRGMAEPGIAPDILARYRRRFALGPEFDELIQRTTLYRFQPRWLRYLDNSVHFGYRAELDLP